MKKLGVFEEDEQLFKYEDCFKKMIEIEEQLISKIQESVGLQSCEQALESFSRGYQFFGIQELCDRYIVREWLPHAAEVYIFGGFNNWNRRIDKLTKIGDIFQIEIDKDTRTIERGSLIKLCIVTYRGDQFDRNLAYSTHQVQCPDSLSFTSKYTPLQHQDNNQSLVDFVEEKLFIYEAHIGLCSATEDIGTYSDFETLHVQRIKDLGYNTIQLMGIQEHAYYGSFGYQVTGFFAPSSRFGTPEQLLSLIRKIKALGMKVIIDLVITHASSNALDGIGDMDGSGEQYFYPGIKGDHPAWGTKIFNTHKLEVIRFILSCVRYWLEVFRVDGFRLDAITSMLYKGHGLDTHFSGSYEEYFTDDLDYVTSTLI